MASEREREWSAMIVFRYLDNDISKGFFSSSFFVSHQLNFIYGFNLLFFTAIAMERYAGKNRRRAHESAKGTKRDV